MMKSKWLTLLAVMLKSTSKINLLKFSHDKKKKGGVIGSTIGIAFIYLLIAAYIIFQSYIMGKMGLGGSIPSMNILALSIVAFIFTLLKSNSYLYSFKEYDMLMSMPFDVKTIVACKFLYMYIKSLALPCLMSFSMMIGYGIALKPKFYVYIIWTVLTFFVQLIPTTIASFLASFAARGGGSGKGKKILQTILIFIVAVFGISLRFIIEAAVRNAKGEAIIANITGASDAAKTWYWPAIWFEKAINDSNLLMFALFIGVSLLIFVAYFTFVAKSYRKINTKLSSYSGNHSKKELSFKKKSVIMSVLGKETKRFFSSVACMTNLGMGQLLVVILGIVSLFFDGRSVLSTIIPESVLNVEKLFPAIPILVFFFIGMTSTTYATPSLEGKSYWIIRSMPISKSDLYKGKMLFNLFMSVPFGWFGVTMFCISCRTSVLEWACFMLCETAFCLWSTTYGMFCGVKFIKLEWENEIEVIKQGTAATAYVLPNIIITTILLAGVVLLGILIPSTVIMLCLTLIFGILAFVMYHITLNLK